MNTQRPLNLIRHARHRGFTLMELMIVITIIAILAAIAIPATKSIIDRAHRAAATSAAASLKTAIGTYFTDYRKYPTRKTGPETAAGIILTDHALMDILLSSDTERGIRGLNPRGKAFFTDKKARPIGGGRYRGGVVLDDQGGGTLWDPWGAHYRVIMDLDYDGKVPAPAFVSDTRYLSGGVMVWSAGKDGKDDEAGDNVVTW